jgi:ATP-binding cassette subfamily C protein
VTGPSGEATVASALLLRIVSSDLSDQSGVEFAVRDTMTIGREAGCDIVLSERAVSRKHASIEPTPDGLRLTDLGSGNGVWIGPTRVEEKILGPGDHFQIGSTVFECVRAQPEPVHAAAPASVADASTIFMTAPTMAAVAPAAVHTPFIVRIVNGSRAGTEIIVDTGVATIGRSLDCTVVVDERDVSRKHAKIESTPDGLLLTDTGSSTGVWIGSMEIKSQLIKPGDRVRLGEHVTIECALVTAAPEPPFDAAQGAPQALEEPAASPDATMFVRTENIPPAEKAPAPPPVSPPEDSNATRMIPVERIAPSSRVAPVPAAPPAPAPPPEPSAPVSPDATVFVPLAKIAELAAAAPKAAAPAASAQAAAPASSIEAEGELINFLAHKPILLDDPQHAWYVVSGGVLIFTVAVENGQPSGTRTHFMGVSPEQCFFGFDIAAYGFGSGFLAVAKQGTQVRKIARARLRELAGDRARRPAVATLVDGWISGLSKALVADFPAKRAGEVKLKTGERVELPPNSKATVADGVAWIELSSGSVMFDDMSTPTFALRSTLFPLTPSSWIQPLSDEFGGLVVTPLATIDALGDAAMWTGLDVFHQALCESEFINKKLAVVDEYVRLEQKAKQSVAAAEAGYDAIGSVLRTDAPTPQDFRATGGTEPVIRACRLVAEGAGIDIRDIPAPDDEKEKISLSFEEHVAIISSTSGFRTRTVALRDDWWERDQGPMLGQLVSTKQPVALLPNGPTAYVAVDPSTGTRQAISSDMAATISAFAYQLYRPFPEGTLRVIDVVKFGARGLSSDIRWIVMMAVVVGIFGTVTPYLTGQVFDVAVPQADRNMLFGVGVALVAAALSSSLFKLTQGIATVRLQAKMSSVIQSAVWDRMLNLPVTFFRKFSAGDLSDRAGGVEAIQELVSGAGVAAILGSVSGLFFVAQMFSYNLRLALLAIGLTIVFVGVNMLCNYLQLRSQRMEIQLRGRIAGLVLNLVTGVSKLRIAGAEQHAFRVWAEQFAQQRRITFRVGTIQNIAATFGSVYPILSSIAIFSVVISEQAKADGQGALTTGDFIAFNAAFAMFMGAMQALGDASLSLLRVVPIYERLLPILTTQPEVDKSKQFPGKLTGAIDLSHLHFRYDPDGPFIVKDISLKINAGEFVAFVGESGCGKSTLMRLMLGFEQPTSGSIYFDGQDLPSLDLRMVRQQMGVVMQQSRVMPCEMYRNIVGATTRSLEEAWEAAEKSGLADDIRNMPMGMHTYVSEGGGTLSGGQRQRLMIARAIVNKPKIIFLDEATSALDNRTQAIVTESMDKMAATRIVIAHRLSTIQNANRICYLKGGQIIEMGTYDELMAKNGMFAELAQRQMA